jgi:biotin transporter BioY
MGCIRITPLQEKLTRLVVSCVMAIIVIFICGFVVMSITQQVPVAFDNAFANCTICHEEMNATLNASACEACRIMWSNVYS